MGHVKNYLASTLVAAALVAPALAAPGDSATTGTSTSSATTGYSPTDPFQSAPNREVQVSGSAYSNDYYYYYYGWGGASGLATPDRQKRRAAHRGDTLPGYQTRPCREPSPFDQKRP